MFFISSSGSAAGLVAGVLVLSDATSFALRVSDDLNVDGPTLLDHVDVPS